MEFESYDLMTQLTGAFLLLSMLWGVYKYYRDPGRQAGRFRREISDQFSGVNDIPEDATRVWGGEGAGEVWVRHDDVFISRNLLQGVAAHLVILYGTPYLRVGMQYAEGNELAGSAVNIYIYINNKPCVTSLQLPNSDEAERVFKSIGAELRRRR